MAELLATRAASLSQSFKMGTGILQTSQSTAGFRTSPCTPPVSVHSQRSSPPSWRRTSHACLPVAHSHSSVQGPSLRLSSLSSLSSSAVLLSRRNSQHLTLGRRQGKPLHAACQLADDREEGGEVAYSSSAYESASSPTTSVPLSETAGTVSSSTLMSEKEKLDSVAKRLEKVAATFQRLGYVSFWVQLVLTGVSAVVLVFSIGVQTNLFSRPLGTLASLYCTMFGIATGFLSVFWAFGYTRLAQRLNMGVQKPKLAPNRSLVLKNVTNGIYINLAGLTSTIVGAEAVIGLLVAKTLTTPSAAAPFIVANQAGAYSPVLALDVFLVQASTNTIAAHFVGLLASLWLLRMVSVNAGGAAPASSPPKSSLPPSASSA